MNTHQHNKGPEQEPKGGLEAAKTPELSSLMQSLAKLRSAIRENDPIDAEEIRKIETQAGKVRVQTGASSVTFDDIKSNPNFRIWAEIMSGDFSRQAELTKLPPFVVSGAKNIQKLEHWFCPELSVLTLDTAKAIASQGKKIMLFPSTKFGVETAKFVQENDLRFRLKDELLSLELSNLTPGWAYIFFDRDVTDPSSSPRDHDSLPSVKTLSPDAVKMLRWVPAKPGAKTGHGIEKIAFPRLKKIDLALARSMAANPDLPTILLEPNTELENEEVAKILSTQVKTEIMFKEVTSKSAPTISIFNCNLEEVPVWLLEFFLRKTPENLCALKFYHLKTVDTEFVKALSRFGHSVYLSIQSLDAKTAKALAKSGFASLTLPGLQDVSPKALKELSAFPGDVELPWKLRSQWEKLRKGRK